MIPFCLLALRCCLYSSSVICQSYELSYFRISPQFLVISLTSYFGASIVESGSLIVTLSGNEIGILVTCCNDFGKFVNEEYLKSNQKHVAELFNFGK